MRGTWIAAIVVAVVCVQPAGVAEVAAQPANAGEAAYQEGKRLYDLREWDRAIDKFKASYELRHDAPSLFNIAQAYRLKGDCAQALGFYKTYRRNFPEAANIDKVDTFIAELEPCANQQAKTVKIEPIGAADAAATQPQHAAAATQQTPAPSGHRTLGLEIGGGGAAMLVGSIVVGALARSKWDDALTHCDAARTCDAQGLSLGDQARTRATIATVLGGVGLAAVGAGAVLYFTSPTPRDRGVAVTPMGGTDRVGVALDGRF